MIISSFSPIWSNLRYNYNEKNFYSTLHNLRNEHGWGAFFTKAKTTLRALTNCQVINLWSSWCINASMIIMFIIIRNENVRYQRWQNKFCGYRQSKRMQQLDGGATPPHRILNIDTKNGHLWFQAERTYAAIGWGGHTTSSSSYSTGVSVLLRKRRTVRQNTIAMAKYKNAGWGPSIPCRVVISM